jgi:hypothetical protein
MGPGNDGGAVFAEEVTEAMAGLVEAVQIGRVITLGVLVALALQPRSGDNGTDEREKARLGDGGVHVRDKARRGIPAEGRGTGTPGVPIPPTWLRPRASLTRCGPMVVSFAKWAKAADGPTHTATAIVSAHRVVFIARSF